MTTAYPNSLDTFSPKVDNFDDVMAADINNVQDAIAAIQALLGGPPLGWYKLSLTATYFSPTSFKIPGDVTALFTVGSKFRCNQSGLKYFYVIASAYAAPDTTVTITGGSNFSLANAAITDPLVSYSANPSGFPHWFNWTPTFTGFSSNPTGVHRFTITGRLCTLKIYENAGVSNATTFTLTAPITPVSSGEFLGSSIDNGALAINPGYGQWGAGNPAISVYRNTLLSAWTASGNKAIFGTVFMEL